MATGTLILLLSGGSLIGFLLAVLGAGGAILLLPMLVGLVRLPTDTAISLSLLIVMLLAIGNAIPYLRRGQFAPRPALQLGLPALLGSWWGARLAKEGLVSDTGQLVIFMGAAVAAAVLMLRQGRTNPASAEPWPLLSALKPRRSPLLLPLQGLLVGLLTGTAGVGGGFAIVPALVLLANLPMQRATGTSLVLIALSSPVALIALQDLPVQQLPLILPILGGGLLGAVIGQRLAPHLSDRLLRNGFAALLLGSALFTAGETLERSRPSGHNSNRPQTHVIPHPLERHGLPSHHRTLRDQDHRSDLRAGLQGP